MASEVVSSASMNPVTVGSVLGGVVCVICCGACFGQDGDTDDLRSVVLHGVDCNAAGAGVDRNAGVDDNAAASDTVAANKLHGGAARSPGGGGPWSVAAEASCATVRRGPGRE